MTNLTTQQSKPNQKIKAYASLMMGVIGDMILIGLFYFTLWKPVPAMEILSYTKLIVIASVLIAALLVLIFGLIVGLKSEKSNIAKAGIIISGIGVAIIMVIVIVIFIVIGAVSSLS